MVRLFRHRLAKAAAGDGGGGGWLRRHRGFRHGHGAARLGGAIALAAGVSVLTVGRAGRVFRAEQRLLLRPCRRPSGGPSCSRPSAASRSCRWICACAWFSGAMPAWAGVCWHWPSPNSADAVFAGGILRRSALCLFHRVGVGRGAFGCFARVGGGAVIGVLVQRHRFVAFFTTGEHKDRGDGQRDRRQMARAPAFAERRMINIFCPFHICLPGPSGMACVNAQDRG